MILSRSLGAGKKWKEIHRLLQTRELFRFGSPFGVHALACRARSPQVSFLTFGQNWSQLALPSFLRPPHSDPLCFPTLDLGLWTALPFRLSCPQPSTFLVFASPQFRSPGVF